MIMRGLMNPLSKIRENKIKKLLKSGKKLYREKRYTDAFDIFSQAAALKSAEAQHYLATCYLNGQGVAFSLQEALLWFESAAQANWIEAQYMLALLHMRGVPEIQTVTGQDLFEQKGEALSDLKSDYETAIVWAKKVAEHGSADGQALYAYLLSEKAKSDEQLQEVFAWYDKAIAQKSPQGYMGKGLLLLKLSKSQDDYAKAAELLEVAAKSGLGTAIYSLAMMYETGEGVEVNHQRAAELYKEAAEMGIRQAQALYGVALKKGYGIERNLVEAETWLRRAAIRGDIEAAVVLADMLASGSEEVPPNYIEAVKWYQYAVEKKKHIGAACSLGYLYLKGLGLSQSTKKAIELFEFSAQKGYLPALSVLTDLAINHPDMLSVDEVIDHILRPQAEQGNVKVMLHLAMALVKSHSLKADPQKEIEARKWLKICSPENIAAQYWYGRMLLQGVGGEEDHKEAFHWIKSSAEKGFIKSQLLWASLLLEGRVEKGKIQADEALKFFHKAAERGDVSGMFSLGAIYGGGNHIEPNRSEAQKWFTKAAELGHPKAQLMLGRYLSRGLAGEINISQGRHWLEKAQKAGEKEATKELIFLQQKEAVSKESKNTNRKKSVQALKKKEQKKDADAALEEKEEIAPGLFVYKKNG